jgi:hypothetical protein
MRAGETVVVCGASADRAQFEPFVWPQRTVVWVGVGCGFLSFLDPGPEDASEESRDAIARAYVRAARGAPVDTERAARGVSSWLRLVERAAKVPCAMVVACGGVRVSAVPLFSVWWSRTTVCVSGPSFRVTERRNGDEVGSPVQPRRILARRGIDVDDETHTVVWCGARSIHIRPRERCALCDAPIRSMFSTFVSAYEQHGSSECAWMRISVCVACPVRAFRIWRVVSLTVTKATGSEEQVLFGEGAHESAWRACGRVVVTLALALTTGRAEPRAGTFASALASALCDMKLMRVVAERLAPPSVASTGPSRALGILVERDIGRK